MKSRSDLDCVVVGAGPAGAVLAQGLARSGLSVVLVDREAHPRWKVCGCCLGARGVSVLRDGGLAAVVDRLEARRPSLLDLRVDAQRATLPLSGTLVVSRTALDAALVEAARDASVTVMEGWSATLGPGDPAPMVLLRRGDETLRMGARLVVAATGLTPLPARPGVSTPEVRVGPRSRIGVGAVYDARAAGSLRPDPDRVVMLAGPAGYLGLSVLEDGAVNLAGALDPEAVRAAGGVEATVATLLIRAGLSLPDAPPRHGWKGTPALTRSATRPGAPGLFLVGDAAGYLEPFTGEGMSWAVESARALTPLAAEVAERGWRPGDLERWDTLRRRTLGPRVLIRTVSWLTRSPRRMHAALNLLSWSPALARSLIRRATGPTALPPPPLLQDDPA